jgi:ribonuclease P protein component
VADESSRRGGRAGASASPSDGGRDGQSFRPADRILRSTDFERVYKEGRRSAGRSFAVFARPNGIGRARLGLTVTRKFGGSVQRNRVKRIVREIFRKNRAAFGTACDFVVNARSAGADRTYAELETELLHAITRKGARPPC